MSMSRFLALSWIAIPLALGTAAAFAHPKLVNSTPTDGFDGEAPQRIELQFSENLVPQFSGASVTMTAMPGMDGSMKVPAKVSATSDPKAMVITPQGQLTTGSYRVDWKAVSSDTHPITGSFSFKVR